MKEHAKIRLVAVCALLVLVMAVFDSTIMQAQNVVTWHNDNSRTGQNVKETNLTTVNVNSTQFGKKFSLAVDQQIYAQPLFVSNLSIPGKGTHNVVFVATENDSVYAFDGNGQPKTPLWHVNFTNAGNGITAVPCRDNGGCAISTVIGITGTPVIDGTSKTMYQVSFTKENGTYVQRLHALDITTGAEKFGGPVVIQASVPGTGSGSMNATVTFQALRQNQRPGLLLLNGVVYIAWASFGDIDPYHGWVMGYSASTLAQVSVYNNTANGSRGGIWQGAAGLSADTKGNIYAISGNGTFDADVGGVDYGDSFIKLSTTSGLSVSDYFTPFNQSMLEIEDLDLGSATGLIPPKQAGSFPNEIISAGKQGVIYVVNRDNMGQFNSNMNNVIQTVTGASGGYLASPAYWNGGMYFSGVGDFVSLYSLSNGLLSNTPLSRSATTYRLGSNPSVSANGTTNGILWAIDVVAPKATGVLHAYDATNLATELYNTTQNSTRDSLGIAVKFSSPTIIRGRVYVGTSNALVVYGLLAH
jgi:hypothetical protein